MTMSLYSKYSNCKYALVVSSFNSCGNEGVYVLTVVNRREIAESNGRNLYCT